MKLVLSIVSLIIAFLLAACINHGGAGPIPLPPCSDPLKCLEGPTLEKRDHCDPPDGPPISYTAAQFFTIKNNNPDHVIRAYLNPTVTHVNEGASSEEPLVTITRDIDPKSKRDIRCRFQIFGPSKWDEYRYTLVKACFLDANGEEIECATVSANLIHSIQPLVPLIAEEKLLTEGALKQLRVMAGHIIDDPDPLEIIDLDPLLKVWNASRNPARILNGKIISVGSQIVQPMEMPVNHPLLPSLKRAVITLPSVVSGDFSRIIGSFANIICSRPTEGIVLDYYDDKQSNIGSEFIKSIIVSKDQITLDGSACFRFIIKIRP